MPVQEFAKIIEAVGHEPFGLLSLAFLVLGSIAYRLVRPCASQRQTSGSAACNYFSGVRGCCAGAGAGNQQRIGAARSTEKTSVLYSGFEVHRATQGIATRGSELPQQLGQVNFGCNESRSVNVAWNAPPGAEQINATASWVNTDNVRSQDQHVVITGNTAAASGVISGRDREWTGNCPGGGHGEPADSGNIQDHAADRR